MWNGFPSRGSGGMWSGGNDQDKPAEMAPVTLSSVCGRPPFPLGFILWFGILFLDQLIRTEDILELLFRLVVQVHPIGSALPCTDDCGGFATMWANKNLHQIPCFEWPAIQSFSQCVDRWKKDRSSKDTKKEPQNSRHDCNHSNKQHTAPIQERRATWFCGSDSQNCNTKRPRAEPQFHRPLMGEEELDCRWTLH